MHRHMPRVWKGLELSTPFSADDMSNAQTDFSFSDDQGVPNRHLTSFGQAMDAPADNLGEDDYRFPGARLRGDDPVTDGDAPADPVQPWQMPTQPRPGYFPRGYAP